jgi:CRP-like cAMP-binding protein
MIGAEAVRLLQVDPELARLLPPGRREEATASVVAGTMVLRIGEWETASAVGEDGYMGLLLLDGILAREVVVADNVSTELLGPGDLVRPWQSQSAEDGLLPSDVRWTALADTRLAILDRRFVARAARHPEVAIMLLHRLTERSQRLATTQAISQLTRVDRRLLALFWHLAERWGRVSRDGVVVPLALSHRILGQLVGARRPTVSSAISDLARRGELLRRDDGSWLLAGDPLGGPDPRATAAVQTRRALAVPQRAGKFRERGAASVAG